MSGTRPPAPDPQEEGGEDLRARVLSLLKRHGRRTTSFQILEPGYEYWFDGDDACVAYADTGAAWVVAGTPVSPPDRTAQVARAFVQAAADAKRRPRFFAVDEGFAEQAALAHTHVGEEPLWNPEAWEITLEGSRSLREQLRRARAKGVRTRVVSGAEMMDEGGKTRRAADRLIQRWLASRPMSPMEFMVLVHPFEYADERRYVIAESDGELLGFAVAVPVYAEGGFFIEDLLRDPEAPNGTSEALVDGMMRQLAAEGCRSVTLGLAPLSGEVHPLLRLTRAYSSGLYNFTGVRDFKQKLRPERWEPVHLAYPRGEIGLRAIADVLSAFAPGGLLRFALRTLVHERTLATALLAILLVPWTVALFLAETDRFFPSRGVQLAWGLFDVVMIGLLAALVRRWNWRLATLVMWLASADAVLTLCQIALFNLPRIDGWQTALIVAAGATGPLLASAFFWAARRVAVGGNRPSRRP